MKIEFLNGKFLLHKEESIGNAIFWLESDEAQDGVALHISLEDGSEHYILLYILSNGTIGLPMLPEKAIATYALATNGHYLDLARH